jgi:hypothetical protein
MTSEELMITRTVYNGEGSEVIRSNRELAFDATDGGYGLGSPWTYR